jgi:hypothetical protein
MARVRQDIKELIKESGGRTRAKRAAESWYENGKKTAAEKSVQTTGGRFQPGKVYVFRYNPKYATELPWYDANPVVLALDPDGNNDVGINLNLLPSDVKERLLDRIYNAYESEIKRESVGGKKNDARRQNQLSIRWEEAKNFLASYKFAIRQYIPGRKLGQAVVSYENWSKIVLCDFADLNGTTYAQLVNEFRNR